MKSNVQLYPTRRRRHSEKPYSSRVAGVIAKNYDALNKDLNKGKYGNFSSMSFEDIFHEAILYVIQDKKAFDLSEKDLMKHFKYRYRMVQYRIIQESKLERIVDVKPESIMSVRYADNI